MSESRYAHALAPGTTIDGYRILDVLGVGGFGITYLAEDTAIGRQVAIKEYLPSELAARRRDGTTVTPLDSSRAESFAFGLARFRDEARTLVAFEHPNIVPVYKYFEANGTAYYAMRYVEGEPLHVMLGRVGTLAEDELLKLIHPLLDGVEEVHAVGFLHRDVKPSNIFIRRNRQPVLIDFGAARMALGEHSKSLTAVLTPGYAPFEQYHARGKQGPWTDIYSLGATFYRCITARTPPEATIRIDALFQKEADPLVPAAEAATAWYDPRLLKAIDKALSVHEADRPQSVAQFRALLPDRARAPARATASTPPVADPKASSVAVSTAVEPGTPSAGAAPPPPPADLPAPPRAVPAPAPEAAGRVELSPSGSLPSTQPAIPAARRSGQAWLNRRSTRFAAAMIGAAVGAAAVTYGMLRWQADDERDLAQLAPKAGAADPNLRATPKPPASPRVPDDAPPAPPQPRAEKPPASPAAPKPPADKSEAVSPAAMERARALRTKADVLWSRTYGIGELRSAVVRHDGLIAVAGSTTIDGRDDRVATLAWLSLGGQRTVIREWKRAVHGEVSRLVAFPDGNLAFAGRIKRSGSGFFDAWIVRLTASGREAWVKHFPEEGNSHVDEAFDLAALEGGRLLFAGQTMRDDPLGDGWAIMVDQNGKKLWELAYGQKDRIEELRKVAALSDGTFMAVGSLKEPTGRERLWLLHVDRHGRVLDETVFEDAHGRNRPTDIQAAGDDVIIAGWTQPANGSEGAAVRWLRKVDAKGGKIWEAVIPGDGSERIWRVLPLNDGGYVLILSKFRTTRAKPRVVRVDQAGKPMWEMQIEGTGMLRDVVALPQGGIVALGVSTERKTDNEAWAVRLGYQE